MNNHITAVKANLLIDQLLELNNKDKASREVIFNTAKLVLGDLKFKALESSLQAKSANDRASDMREAAIHLICLSQTESKPNNSSLNGRYLYAQNYLDNCMNTKLKGIQLKQDDINIVGEKFSNYEVDRKSTVNQSQESENLQKSPPPEGKDRKFKIVTTSGSNNKCAIHAGWGKVGPNSVCTHENPEGKIKELSTSLSKTFSEVTKSGYNTEQQSKNPLIDSMYTTLESKITAVKNNEKGQLRYMPDNFQKLVKEYIANEEQCVNHQYKALIALNKSLACKDFFLNYFHSYDLYGNEIKITKENLNTILLSEKHGNLTALVTSNPRFKELSKEDQSLIENFIKAKYQLDLQQSLLPLMGEVLKLDKDGNSEYSKMLLQENYPLESKDLGTLWVANQKIDPSLPDLVILKSDTGQLEKHGTRRENISSLKEARENNCKIIHHGGDRGFHYSLVR